MLCNLFFEHALLSRKLFYLFLIKNPFLLIFFNSYLTMHLILNRENLGNVPNALDLRVARGPDEMNAWFPSTHDEIASSTSEGC